jgi:hypothetical protein
MERITNCCRNCLHLGRIKRQPPDSCHILEMPVLIVYTTTMTFNICKYKNVVCWKDVSIRHVYIVICHNTPEVICKLMEEEE